MMAIRDNFELKTQYYTLLLYLESSTIFLSGIAPTALCMGPPRWKDRRGARGREREGEE